MQCKILKTRNRDTLCQLEIHYLKLTDLEGDDKTGGGVEGWMNAVVGVTAGLGLTIREGDLKR